MTRWHRRLVFAAVATVSAAAGEAGTAQVGAGGASAALQAPQPTADEASAKLKAYLERASAEGFTGVVLVARGDTILVEAGYGLADPASKTPVGADTVFTVGSITKQFTAAAILKLEMLGRLSVTDPLAKHVSGVPSDKRGITLHHLLTHTAGFPGAIGDDFARIGRDDFVALALRTKLLSAPGTRYEYSNVGYSLLAAVVERVSGQGYEAFLQRHLFGPAGMRDTGYVVPRWDRARIAHGYTPDGGDWGTLVDKALSGGGPGWHLLGNGGIHSTAGDMLRWHRALEGEAVLNDAAKAKMYARHVEEPGGTHYGYGWSIEKMPWGEVITHNGGNPYYFSDFLRFPESGVVIYYSTTSRERRMRRLARPLARIVFTGEVPDLPPAPAEAPAMGAPVPAPSGSLAAKWKLPGSARAMRVAEFLEAWTTNDQAVRRGLVDQAFAPDLVARRTVEGLVALFDRLRADIGEFAVRGLRVTSPTAATLVIDSRATGTRVELQFEFEPSDAQRITSVGVEIGG